MPVSGCAHFTTSGGFGARHPNLPDSRYCGPVEAPVPQTPSKNLDIAHVELGGPKSRRPFTIRFTASDAAVTPMIASHDQCRNVVVVFKHPQALLQVLSTTCSVSHQTRRSRSIWLPASAVVPRTLPITPEGAQSLRAGGQVFRPALGRPGRRDGRSKEPQERGAIEQTVGGSIRPPSQ